jgi:hypothetical protein
MSMLPVMEIIMPQQTSGKVIVLNYYFKKL